LVSDGQRVYLINGSSRQPIGGGAFLSYGYPWSIVKAATTGDMGLTVGTAINDLAPGTLAVGPDGVVYVISASNGVAQKQWISASTFSALGYNWNRIMHVSQSQLPTNTVTGFYANGLHPSGTLVSSAGAVYLIDGSTRRPITAVAFISNYYQWNAIVPASSADTALTLGPTVDIRTGTLLYSGGGIYVTDADSTGVFKRPVGPWECFANRVHYTSADWFTVNTGDLPPRTGSLYTC
jgi:hypothetical protein